MKHLVRGGHVEGAAHPAIRGEGFEDGRAVDQLTLPVTLLDHCVRIFDVRGLPLNVETWQLTVPKNVKLGEIDVFFKTQICFLNC